MLQLELDLLSVIVKNKQLQWYFRVVKPRIERLVTKEKEETNPKNMPFTRFIFTYIMKVKKCCEKD